MWWNKVLPTKEWSRDSLTRYELDFWSDYVSIVKVKSQNVWSRSVDFCGDGEGKTWRGVDSTPPLAEIGLTYDWTYRSQWTFSLREWNQYFNIHEVEISIALFISSIHWAQEVFHFTIKSFKNFIPYEVTQSWWVKGSVLEVYWFHHT